MKVRDIAHSRTGDKGDTSNISVIAFDAAHYELLRRHLTPDAVKAHFSWIVKGVVTRYELPQLGALNFVMTHTLGGGVTRSLALDAHGKCLSSYMLEFELPEAVAQGGI
ncbi:MAG TPA: hypothetical protein VFR20_03900 [Burkholderiaceae bacterium]|nr:hypothetical protein [Burkholderiaceae bacterium]